ncbi:hypothetical protein CYLTODRAFT_425139 [Cylindrobasidium torrendii FP15055 ss-10]|uniref:Stealth protein CR3 conserved region 3 domain-containing protein n=1 Tax=Cylindrobasidium torrendii FP15055 ss-10 TaxID=1314674 RepID=A0A0D7B2S3_9AGAR|nr:hypothetical protein CYLTODRAFT_425139 [Cylindrobasidium torrendii FP15055 ss-10]
MHFSYETRPEESLLPQSNVDTRERNASKSFWYRNANLPRFRLLVAFFVVVLVLSALFFLDYPQPRTLEKLIPEPFVEPSTGISTPLVNKPNPVVALPSPNSTNTYHRFTPNDPTLSVANHHLQRITAYNQIPDACLDHWVATGRWEPPCHGVKESLIDVIWVWVNGSDPLHVQSRNEYLLSLGEQPKEARFREHDELKYSLRSVAAATSTWRKSLWHIVTSDVHSTDSGSHLGLVPQWLDLNATSTNRELDVQPINIIEHINLFRLFNSTSDALSVEESISWKDKVLPTFNSLAIESQLPNLDPSTVAENFVFLNDDQFLTLPMAPSTFHTPLYGPVFRLEGLMVSGDPKGTADGNGEWRGLGWSAHQLNERFGSRKRAYVSHNARSMSRPLLHEASLAFPSVFSTTPLSRFRGSHSDASKGEIELNTVFLATHWIIERRREALLWSYIVAKWGGEDGQLNGAKRDDMWIEMGGSLEHDKISLDASKRTTHDHVDVQLERAQLASSRVSDRDAAAFTEYSFVSQDGYPHRFVTPRLAATLSRSECLDLDDNSAWALFMKVAQTRVECGDAFINALVQQQGAPGGLEIFLPAGNSTASTALMPVALPVQLPEIDPALPVAVHDLRAFAVRLIHRYSYVAGETPSHFFGMTSLRNAQAQLEKTTRQKDVALLCINDDLADIEKQVKAADKYLRGWFNERWPDKGEWELAS